MTKTTYFQLCKQAIAKAFGNLPSTEIEFIRYKQRAVKSHKYRTQQKSLETGNSDIGFYVTNPDVKFPVRSRLKAYLFFK